VRFATLAMVFALALGTNAAVAAAQTGDLVYGSGTTDVESTFDLTVEGSATGTNPTGHFSLAGSPGVYSWEATPRCMNAAGDRATLGFVIDSGTFAGQDLAGRAVLLWVQDVSGPGLAYFRVIDAGDPIVCADPRSGPDPAFTTVGVTGSVYVADRQPPIPAGSDSVAGETTDCLSTFPDQTCERTLLSNLQAVSGPAGGNPTGIVSWYDAGPTPGGSSTSDTAVTCLSVNGHAATIGVTGSRHRYGASDAVFPIAGLVRMVDAGGPDSGADTFQFALQVGSAGGPPLPGPSSCTSYPGTFPTGSPLFPDFTNETRDVRITDAQPPATSKEQCKNGGWRQYGFKNQGACIAFVIQKAVKACVFEQVAIGRSAFRSKYGGGRFDLFAMLHCIARHVDG
jgi:hypothetical protein